MGWNARRRNAVRLTPPVKMALEKSLASIEDDELVGITPKSIRLRKPLLDPNARKRAFRAKGKRVSQRNSIMRAIAAISQSAMWPHRAPRASALPIFVIAPSDNSKPFSAMPSS